MAPHRGGRGAQGTQPGDGRASRYTVDTSRTQGTWVQHSGEGPALAADLEANGFKAAEW